MENNVSAELLLNLIQEKYGVYKSSFSSLLSILSENDQANKIRANQTLLSSSNDLANILANGDRPNWLNHTISITTRYQQQNKNTGSSWHLLKELMKIYAQATQHNWDFSSQGNIENYDFNEIYEAYRKNSDLTSLFESLIKVLNEMVNSGEIDSIKAISALNELISTLNQNKNSSYFSTMASWEFVKSFTKNVIWEQVNNIPGIKPCVKAFEKTMSDMDIEMDALHKGIAEELQNKYKMTIKSALTYRKDDQLLLEDKTEN